MEVAILGGGLVGRIAAWGVMAWGATPIIIDRQAEAIAPKGFTYLHDKIDLPLSARSIDISFVGDEFGYESKIYGTRTGSSSWKKYFTESGQIGYSPKEALDILNGLTHTQVRIEHLDGASINNAVAKYSAVINTLPAPMFFPDEEWKNSQSSVASYRIKEEDNLPNFCVYNGIQGMPWSRAGAMFGYAFYEFPGIVPGHQVVTKVVSGPNPNEICQYKNVLFTGRFGAWKKHALSHDTYYEVIEWLDSF